jgi:hypothetical protein
LKFLSEKCVLGEAFVWNKSKFSETERGDFFAGYSLDEIRQAQANVRQAKSRIFRNFKGQKVMSNENLID